MTRTDQAQVLHGWTRQPTAMIRPLAHRAGIVDRVGLIGRPAAHWRELLAPPSRHPHDLIVPGRRGDAPNS